MHDEVMSEERLRAGTTFDGAMSAGSVNRRGVPKADWHDKLLICRAFKGSFFGADLHARDPSGQRSA